MKIEKKNMLVRSDNYMAVVSSFDQLLMIDMS